jgi:hypothetical protein
MRARVAAPRAVKGRRSDVWFANMQALYPNWT